MAESAGAATCALPLDGVRVLDLTSLGMGPLATQTLGDLGADVIKVESPDGDVFRWVVPQGTAGMSHAFLQLNRNKRSVVLDLTTDDGRAALDRLIATCDVLVCTMRPQAAAKLGVDYARVRGLRADVIYCAAYGYSESGPYAGRPAADDTIQAMSGLAWLQREVSGQSQFVATIAADKVCGMAVVQAILAAVIHRLRTGEGQAIEVPMFETMVAWNMVEHMAGMTFDPPKGSAGYSRVLNPDRRPFRTADGWLCILPYTTRQWLAFFRLIGRDDLADDPAMADPVHRSAAFRELYQLINAAAPTRTTAAWVEALLANDILFGEVKAPADLLADPHLAATGLFHKVTHASEGDIRLLGFPTRYSAMTPAIRRLPPTLGEHSDEVLAELAITVRGPA